MSNDFTFDMKAMRAMEAVRKQMQIDSENRKREEFRALVDAKAAENLSALRFLPVDEVTAADCKRLIGARRKGLLKDYPGILNSATCEFSRKFASLLEGSDENRLKEIEGILDSRVKTAPVKQVSRVVEVPRAAVRMGRYDPSKRKPIEIPETPEPKTELIGETVRFYEADIYGSILEGVVADIGLVMAVVENEYGRWDVEVENLIVVEEENAEHA